jgi:hypothetical protein
MMPVNVRGFSWLMPRMNLNSPVLSAALPLQAQYIYSDTVSTAPPRAMRALAYDAAKVRLKSGPVRKPRTFYAIITLNKIHDLALVDNLR